jgi:flagellin
MGLRINTNINAMYSINNLNNTNNKLSQSLNRLSTGLRITKAADDSAGMTIADGLKLQATNLGQAINNGNNATKLIQIADMALQKSIDIVGTIAQKATQAANATEDSDSRAALQSDINKYIEELNNIATTTSYKGVNLLDGTFTNKLVHVGAYMNQTLSIGAQRTHSDSIGWVAQTGSGANVAFLGDRFEKTSTSTKELGFDSANNYVNLVANDLTINGTNIANYAEGVNKDQQLDAKTMVTAINNVKSQTGGVEAEATTTVTGTAAITAGAITAGTFFINGQDIGAVNVTNGDADNALVNKINQFQDTTGVVASKNSSGQLVLTASDGRNIAIKADSNVTGIVHLADSETYVSGLAKTLSGSKTLSFYLNGTHISFKAGTAAASAVSIATAINNALTAAGIDTTTQIKASYTAATGGYLKIFAIDGRDLNIHMTSTAANVSNAVKILGLANSTALGGHSDVNYIANNSSHGTITLTSTDNITIGGLDPSVAGLKAGTYSPSYNLADVNVTTQSGAELALKITQSALSDLDKVRSDLGSVQNQIQATVENISVTQINISGAESTIRDVNFASESSNFSKLQILAQSGTYALAQSNAVQQNVLRLLQ